MREIKFRAWDTKYSEMSAPFGLGNKTVSFGDIVNFRFAEFKPDVLIVMQYTGLKDKNGKEIYEGDIVKCGKFALNDTEKYGVRCWERLPDGIKENDISTIIDVFNIEFTPEGLMTLKACIENNPDVVGVEIIGNIYENPELLPEPPEDV